MDGLMDGLMIVREDLLKVFGQILDGLAGVKARQRRTADRALKSTLPY
jgi:hypothetical protein